MYSLRTARSENICHSEIRVIISQMIEHYKHIASVFDFVVQVLLAGNCYSIVCIVMSMI